MLYVVMSVYLVFLLILIIGNNKETKKQRKEVLVTWPSSFS